MLANPKDPLRNHGAESQRELFDRFSKAANGFSTEDVISAAANILINALRQAHPTRPAAERAYDELFGRIKSLLVEHYDSLGRKRGVFPYHQTINVPLMIGRRKH